MTNWEKYFGTPQDVCDTLDKICITTDCLKCPFYGSSQICTIDKYWLESEASE